MLWHATLHLLKNFGLKDLVTALKEQREFVRERVLRALERQSGRQASRSWNFSNFVEKSNAIHTLSQRCITLTSTWVVNNKSCIRTYVFSSWIEDSMQFLTCRIIIIQSSLKHVVPLANFCSGHTTLTSRRTWMSVNTARLRASYTSSLRPHALAVFTPCVYILCKMNTWTKHMSNILFWYGSIARLLHCIACCFFSIARLAHWRYTPLN